MKRELGTTWLQSNCTNRSQLGHDQNDEAAQLVSTLSISEPGRCSLEDVGAAGHEVSERTERQIQ